MPSSDYYSAHCSILRLKFKQFDFLPILINSNGQFNDNDNNNDDNAYSSLNRFIYLDQHPVFVLEPHLLSFIGKKSFTF